MAPSSTLTVCTDIPHALGVVLQRVANAPHLVIERDDFLVDDAHELIGQAHVASDVPRFFITAANTYNLYSQNALLKLLEEPPRNIYTILIAPRKSIFLPTIRSRLPIEVIAFDRPLPESPLDFERLDLAGVYHFLRTNPWFDRDKAKALLECALEWYRHQKNIPEPLNGRILQALSRSFRLLTLNSLSATVLPPLLLLLLEAKEARAR